eukprot:g18002.t1
MGEHWDEVEKWSPCGVNKTGLRRRYVDSGDEKNCKHDLMLSTEYEYVESDPGVPHCPECGDLATAIGYKRQQVLKLEDPGGKCGPKGKKFMCAASWEKNMQRCKDRDENACKLSATDYNYPEDYWDAQRCLPCGVKPFDCATSELKTAPCDCKLGDEGDWEMVRPCPWCGRGFCLRCGEDKLSGGKNCLLALEIGLGAVVLILVALLVQDVTGFAQEDPLFTMKLTQYAELLANSGRMTSAMRQLSRLKNDPSSALLRHRIFHSLPQEEVQKGQFQPGVMPFDQVQIKAGAYAGSGGGVQTGYGAGAGRGAGGKAGLPPSGAQQQPRMGQKPAGQPAMGGAMPPSTPASRPSGGVPMSGMAGGKPAASMPVSSMPTAGCSHRQQCRHQACTVEGWGEVAWCNHQHRCSHTRLQSTLHTNEATQGLNAQVNSGQPEAGSDLDFLSGRYSLTW